MAESGNERFELSVMSEGGYERFELTPAQRRRAIGRVVGAWLPWVIGIVGLVVVLVRFVSRQR